MHSDLGKVIQSLLDEFWKSPPALMSSGTAGFPLWVSICFFWENLKSFFLNLPPNVMQLFWDLFYFFIFLLQQYVQAIRHHSLSHPGFPLWSSPCGYQSNATSRFRSSSVTRPHSSLRGRHFSWTPSSSFIRPDNWPASTHTDCRLAGKQLMMTGH